jgi:urease accessory protein
VENDGVLALVPDPIVCFAGARYDQHIEVDLAPEASLVLLDGYTCGRKARGERWEFAHYASRTTVKRDGVRAVVDNTRLDPANGPIAERMGRFDVALTLLVFGPRLAAVRESILTTGYTSSSDSVVVAASPIGRDGCMVRVVSERFESASRALRSSFTELARFLGDDPMARKW